MAHFLTSVFIAILVVGYLTDAVLNELNQRRWRTVLPAKLADFYTRSSYGKAKAYHRENYRLSVLQNAVSVVLIVYMIQGGGFEILDRFLRGVISSPFWLSWLFLLLLYLANDLIHLPFQLHDTFVIEEKYGFNRMKLPLFLLDKLKSWVIGAVIFAVLLFFAIPFYEAAGEWGWVAVWGAITLFTVFIQFYYTTLLLPLFNRLTPLDEGVLKTKIRNFCRSVEFPVDQVFVIDGSKRSTRANASFSGFGKKKKIILYDTLIEKFTNDELIAILAHEIGHYKKKHMIQGTVLSILSTGLILFLLYQFLAYPVFSLAIGVSLHSFHSGLIAFGILAGPVSLLINLGVNALIRRNEFEADRFAAIHARAGDLIAALKKLSVTHFSNLDPHPLYVLIHYTHPPVLSRIEKLAEPPAVRR